MPGKTKVVVTGAGGFKRRWVKTTDSDHSYPVYPNLLKGLQVTRPNQAWVANITYIRILTGFLYWAVILDLFSRCAAYPRSSQNSRGAKTACAGLYSSFGPGGAICLPWLCGGAEKGRL